MYSTNNELGPHWSTTTKLIVTFFLVVIIGLLLWKFQFILGPLLFAIVLAYLLHPVAGLMHRKIHLPWRVAVTLLYLFIFLIVIGLIAWGGISLVQPVQNLIIFLQKLIVDLPNTLSTLSKQVLVIGPITLNLTSWNLSQLWTELQGIISPALASLGTLVGSIASGAVSTITWIFFTLIVSYFFAVESSGLRSNMIQLNIPKYQVDFDRMKMHLSKIWGAFLRGQLTIFVLTYIIYCVMLAALGEKYFLALAILAGLARFVPYVGPFVAWTTYGMVALFQGSTIFGLLPLPYALIIVGCAILIDAIMDNFISPRVMSNALSVHPAAVLVTVIVALKLIGFIGVLLAAPVLASLKLFMHYITHKLMDLDPWIDMEIPEPPLSLNETFAALINRLKVTGNRWISFFKKNRKKPDKISPIKESEKEN
jgi:predicted PurR-regulated permease PerM